MNILDVKEPERSYEFLNAFHYAQQGTGKRLQLGKLAFLYRDKKYYESIKIAHEFIDRYVDKAVKYRESHSTLLDATPSNSLEQVASGNKIVLLNEMAMETSNREELRNQILHGR